MTGIRLRTLSLTADHVARVHRLVEDSGVEPGMEIHTDADYDEWVERILASHPASHLPTQLFAFGSLTGSPN
jgi:cation transport protein ChaC